MNNIYIHGGIVRSMAVIVLMPLLLVGCGQDSKKSEAAAPAPVAQAQTTPPAPVPPPPAQPPQPDPVALLKKHLVLLQESCSGGKVITCRSSEGKTEEHPAKPLRNVRFDVQRSSSLVSPFIGQVAFEQIDNDKGGFTKFEIALAFQDGTWGLTNLRYNQWNEYIGDWNGEGKDPYMKQLHQSYGEMETDEFRQRMGVR